MDKLYQDGTKCPQIENLAEITPEQAAGTVRWNPVIEDKTKLFRKI